MAFDLFKKLELLDQREKNAPNPDTLKEKGHREIKSFESFSHNEDQKRILDEVKKIRDKHKDENTFSGSVMNKSQNIDDIVFIDNYDPWMITKGTYRKVVERSIDALTNPNNPDLNVYNKVLIEFYLWEWNKSYDKWRLGLSWWGYPRDIIILEKDFDKYGKLKDDYDGMDKMLWINAEPIDKIESYYLFRITDALELEYQLNLKDEGINVIGVLDGRYFLIEEDIIHSLLRAYLLNYPQHIDQIKKTIIDHYSLRNFKFNNSHLQKFGDDIEHRLFNHNLKRFRMSDSSDLADSSSELY